jgi:hypothetical protein
MELKSETYSVDPNIVTHHVAAGLIPSWTGSEQPRPCTFDHGRLIIGAGNQKLVWERPVKHGDLFINGMTPMPGEGHVSQTIANCKALEALDADRYVAGPVDFVLNLTPLRFLMFNAFVCARKGAGNGPFKAKA